MATPLVDHRSECGAGKIIEARRPRVSVIVPTKDRTLDLEATLASLFRQSVLPYEVVIVDQSKEPGRLPCSAWPGAVLLQYIYDPSISGASQARNRGMALATGDILLFLDDDVVLDRFFIEEILRTYHEDSKLDGVSGIITNYPRPPWPRLCWMRFFKQGPFFDERQEIYWNAERLRGELPIPIGKMGGGLMSFRAESVYGLEFDENLTGSSPGEDVDFCVQLLEKRDGRLALNPNARLEHKKSPAGRTQEHWLETEVRSWRYLYVKNWSRSIVNRLCFAWLTVGFLALTLFGCVRRFSCGPWIAFRAGMRKGLAMAGAGLLCLLLTVGCATDPIARRDRLVKDARSLMQQGKLQAAVIQLRRAIQYDKRHGESYYLLAQAEIGLRQWSPAFKALEEAHSLQPDRLDIRMAMGQIYLGSRDFDQAEQIAKEVLDRDPNSAAAYQLLGGVYIGREEPDKALAALRRTAELAPKDPAVWTSLAIAVTAVRQWEDAERFMKKALEADPHYVQGYQNLANYYRTRRRPDDEEQILRTGLAVNPQATDLFLAWADTLVARGKQNDAQAVLAELRKRNGDAGTAVKIGDFLYLRKDTEKALSEYRRAVELAPSSRDARVKMVDVLLGAGRVPEAEAVNNIILDRQPKDVMGRVGQARILLARGQRREAIAELRKQVTEAPESSEPHFFLGMAYWEDGDLAVAKSELNAALAASPDAPAVLAAAARFSLSQGEADVAQERAERLVQIAPSDVDYRLLLVRALLAGLHATRAVGQLEIALASSPSSADVYLALGEANDQLGKPEDAEKAYEAALRLSPRNERVLAALADSLERAGHHDRALVRFRQYVGEAPGDAAGHLILGFLLYRDRNLNAARAELEKALQVKPDSVKGRLQLAQVLQDMGESDAALAHYEKALAAQPRFAPLETLVGNLYLDRNDLVKARRHYEAALAVDPNFAIACGNLALVLTRQGASLDLALDLAQKAQRQLPDLDSITDTLAWVYFKRGAYGNAIPLMEDCVRKAPSRASYRYHLGMALLATGEKNKARSELQAALRLKLSADDSLEAQRALDSSSGR